MSIAQLSRPSGNKHTEGDSLHVHVLRQVNLESEILAILRSEDCTESFGNVNLKASPAHGANIVHCGVSMLRKLFIYETVDFLTARLLLWSCRFQEFCCRSLVVLSCLGRFKRMMVIICA